MFAVLQVGTARACNLILLGMLDHRLDGDKEERCQHGWFAGVFVYLFLPVQCMGTFASAT